MPNLPTTLRFLAAIACAFACLTSAVPAFAQDDEKARAVELIKEANAATEAGEHRDALMKYKAAFDLMEDPRILYRIGLSYENLGNYQRAREHFELYLFADPNSEYKGRIEKKITALKEKEKTLQAKIEIVSNPAGAKVFVDGEMNKAFGKTPITLPVGAGEHTLIVKMGKAEKSSKVTVKEGETAKQTFELGPEALEGDPDAADSDTTEEVVTTGGGERELDAAPRQRTVVDIAKPNSMLVIGWGLIAAASIVGAVALGFVGSNPIMLGAGGLALIGGGFILWFNPDSETDDLPRVGIDDKASMSVGASWSMQF